VGFTTADWIVLGLYLVIPVAMGGVFYSRQKTSRDYLLAGRSMSWFPIAISIIATDLSALSYMGIPALVYKADIKYLLAGLMFPLQMALVIVIFVPLLYRLNVFTVYEYLERRFNPAARLLAAALFLGGRGAWIATITFATSVVLTQISGMNTGLAILICGMSTTVYTFLGGMEAVIWTDFMQFFVLVGGAVAILILVIVGFHGDVGQIWSIASATGHTKMFDFSFSLTREYTFWSLVVGTLIYQLSTYGTDQINVQRYFATKNLRETIKATIGSALILLPVIMLLFAIGIGLSAYYIENPELAATLESPDRIMPHFTVNILPRGFRGLVIAGIFAATMSSMSSGINSLTTSTMKDFLERLTPSIKERELFWARIITALWGLAATLGAMLMVNIKLTILERFNSIYTFFAGPLVGMFLLGILTKRASAWPVVFSSISGFAATAAVAKWTNVHWLWYSPVGCLTTMIIGYLGSLMSRQTNESEANRYTLSGSRKLTPEADPVS
jgi:solute:Na+ symporter, SSS family